MIDHVADVRTEADQRAGKVNSFTDAGQARCRYVVLLRTEQSSHVPKAVCTTPSTVSAPHMKAHQAATGLGAATSGVGQKLRFGPL